MFGNEWLWGNIFILLIRLGSGRAMTSDMIPPVKDDITINVAKKYLGSPEEGLAELRRIYSEESSLSIGNLAEVSFWSAHFGDPELSMEAMERALRISAQRTWYIWLPVMNEVRQLPRFKEFVREIGLVNYWEKFGWPDFYRPLDNGDFECD